MKSKRLFVFDMDGVLVASEKMWMETEPRSLEELFGDNIARCIGDTVGISMGQVYERAVACGARMEKSEFDRRYTEVALRVYGRCPITAGCDKLVSYLTTHGWVIALLSSSPMTWINAVLVRLPWRAKLTIVLSLNEHPELRAKPTPDGYRFLLREFNVAKEDSIALEDSNPGIVSAKAAGLFTIGYREHLPAGYEQKGANITAETMKEVLVRLLEL